MASCLRIIFTLHFVFILFFDYVKGGNTVVCDKGALAESGYDPNKLHFCDKTLPYQVRANDLVQQLTLDEKIAQLGDKAAGVSRLHIPAYNWRSEALHGVSDVGMGSGTHFDGTIRAATSFPIVLLTAASFNETLWKAIGEAISDEARAMHNAGLSGLTVWSPNVNVAIDPRWGRIQETAGEDPFLVSRYAVNYVRGLQDVKGYINVPNKNSRPLKVAACCKYYTAYDMERWGSGSTKKMNGSDRFHFDSKVQDRDMTETYNYPFEICVKEGDVASVMCSYNKVNGIPTCANPKLLNSTVRGLWGLNGFIVDDCDWVLATVASSQENLNATLADEIAQAFKAGVDLDCRGEYSPQYIKDAITQGKLTEAEIDHALINLYVMLMRLGWFDGSPGNYLHLGQNDVCSKKNLELAAEAARQGIVLLLNNDNVLPLPLNYSGGRKPTVAVVGPHANASTAMLGSYALKTGTACRYVTPLDGIKGYANVKYAPGCLDVKCESISGFQAAVDATRDTDATILFVGLDQTYEYEDTDRINIYPPTEQMSLYEVLALEPSVKHLIIVVLSAGGVDLAAWTDKVDAILWAGYPGAEGGQAIADILFGKHDPAGRLPISWYKGNYTYKLPMSSMQLRPNPSMGYPGRTYKYCTDDDIIYPFGYGMSYTTFNQTISEPTFVSIERPRLQKCKHIAYPYEDLDCPSIAVADSKCNDMVKIVVTVKNTGQRNGAHVVVLFSSPPAKIGITVPKKRLVGFQRVFIKSGESLPVEFNLNVCKSFSFISDDADEILPAGVHSISAGNDFSGSLVLSERTVSTPISIVFHQGNNLARRIAHL